MSISSIQANYLPGASSPNQSTGADARIRSLEQKLQQLHMDKEKAALRKDEKEKQKLEKQIKEVEEQILQLKQQEKKKAEKTEPEASGPQTAVENSSDMGEYIDIYG